MILLLQAHREYYPGIPFMPWHYGTPTIEHFFGLCRSFIPDFTFSQLVDIYKHAELRQHLLATGQFNYRREKDSNNGYSFDPWINGLTESELTNLKLIPAPGDINNAISIGWNEAAAASRLCGISPPQLPLSPSDLPRFLQNDYGDSLRVSQAQGTHVSQPTADPALESDNEHNLEPSGPQNTGIVHIATSNQSASGGIAGIRPSAQLESNSQKHVAEAVFRVAQSSAIDKEIAETEESLLDAQQHAFSSDEALDNTAGRMSLRYLLNTDTMAQSLANKSPPPSTFLPVGYPEVLPTWKHLANFRESCTAATNVNSEWIRNSKPNPKYSSGHFSPNAASHQLTNEINGSETLRAGTATQKSRYQRWTHRGERLATAIGCELSKSLQDLPVPNVESAGISELTPMERGSLVIMNGQDGFYLGEVLGIYCAGATSGRHDSFTDATTAKGLSYLSLKVFVQANKLNLFQHRIEAISLFTHAPASDLVYLLHGVKLTENGDKETYSLPGNDNAWPRSLRGPDETLDIVGVVMLGIVTGGLIVRPDIDDHKQRRFLESFELYPQIWFSLSTDHNPTRKDFTIDVVHRLASRARGSDLMINGVATEHPEIEQTFLSALTFHNASQRRSGRIPRWESIYTGLDLLHVIAGLKYEPVPHRLMGNCPMIHLACKPTNPGGVRWLLNVVLEAVIEASSVRTKVELEESWNKSELSRGDCGSVFEEGSLSYRFGPWHNGTVKKKDAVTQTSGLEHEDWPSNTLISGLQELYAGTVETNRFQETPPHVCRSHMYMPTSEATGHYSPSHETASVDCSMPGGLFLPSGLQANEPRNSPPLSDTETRSNGQSSNPELYLDDHSEHPSRLERDIISEFIPPNKNGVQAAHVDWFDLIMSEEGNELPDLSDWRDVHTGQTPPLWQIDYC
ncbi:unnamed protein product [Rhizoctonia solani]|uniref:Uncharacterized protein n=1 Tax=Rhizoctonia solani TaxID=456999 RepID=A0A8H3HNT1_9AGAM|nr:unnamed protein product [Rhizoctonia solani]